MGMAVVSGLGKCRTVLFSPGPYPPNGEGPVFRCSGYDRSAQFAVIGEVWNHQYTDKPLYVRFYQ